MAQVAFNAQRPPEAGPPGPDDMAPEGVVAKLLDEGETDYAIVDFPRKRADGTVIAKVRVRVLSDHEWTLAKANALAEMGRLLKSGEKANPDLEHNLTVRWVLAEACRDPADPKRRFFHHGAFDVRRFQDREIAELWLAYLVVRNAGLPSLGEMTGPELEAWAERVEEGVESFPFYFASQESVQAFLTSVARYVASKAKPEATPPTPDDGSTTGSSGSA